MKEQESIVKIVRYKNVFQEKNSTSQYGLTIWSEQNKIKICPVFMANGGGAINTGFSPHESDYQLRLFSESIFQEVVITNEINGKIRNWYINDSVEIPYNGLSLNITEIEGEDGKKRAKVPLDYIRWRYLSVHPSVAKNKKSCNTKHTAYILNEDEIKQSEVDKIREKRMVDKIVNSIDELYYPMYLYIAKTMGYKELKNLSLTELKKDDIFINFEMFKDKYPLVIRDIYNDEDSKIRYIIARAIELMIIKVGRGNKYTYELQLLGSNLDEVVIWFKDPINQEAVLHIKAAVEDQVTEELYGDKRVKTKKKPLNT